MSAVAAATPFPRTWLGNTSLITVHTIGPSEKAKLAMKVTVPTRASRPAFDVPCAAASEALTLVEAEERAGDQQQAEQHAPAPDGEQRLAAEAVDVQHGDERGEDVHPADRPERGEALLGR